MELYIRPVSIFDEQLLIDFANEYRQTNTKIEAGDCSLILGKSYEDYENFYAWYQEEENLNQEKNLKRNQVGCSSYLILTKEEEKLIALLDIRHSLNYPHGQVYGHIGVEIRPKERGKGYYKEILQLTLTAIKDYDINKVIISCEYSNIASKRGIEHVFGKEYQLTPVEGTYYLVYAKELRKRE